MIESLNPFNTKRGRPIEFNRYSLELNRLYVLTIGNRKPIGVRFIQSSPKGYNFLNVRTGQCIFATSLPNAFFGHLAGEQIGVLLSKEHFILQQPPNEINQKDLESYPITKKRDGFLRLLWIGKDKSELEIKDENEGSTTPSEDQ